MSEDEENQSEQSVVEVPDDVMGEQDLANTGELSAQDAIDLPNIIARGETIGVEIDVEGGPKAADDLRAMGYTVEERTGENSGLHVIAVREDGLEGGADKRREGIAVSVLPGTQGLYSFTVGFLCFDALDDGRFLTVFACGVLTGIACLMSGWWQGVVCAASIKSINHLNGTFEVH